MEDIKKKGNIYYIGQEENPDAYIKYTEEEPGVIAIVSTFVDPKLRGQGVASKLTKKVVEFAREEDLKIIPVCSYAVEYFERHEEIKDLLK